MTETAASLTDEAARLFDEFRSGRRDGLDALVRLLTPTLWHLARACGLERADAEDVMQQAWMQLVAKADTVRDPQSVVAWVGTTVRREAWRVRRNQGRSILVEEPPDGADTEPDPGDVAVLHETRTTLGRHLAALSPRCRALLRVVSRGGAPDYGALAASLGMPVGSVGPTRGRCLAKLRAALEADPTWSER